MPARTPTIRFARLLLVAGAALWTLDVLVSLAVPGALLGPGPPLEARARDFAGLAVAALPLALLLSLAALAGGPVVARLLRSEDAAGVSVALLGGALAGLGAGLGLYGLSASSLVPLAVTLAAVGLCVFAGVRGLQRLGKPDASLLATQQFAALPAVLAAAGAEALQSGRGAAVGVALLACVALAVSVRGGLSRRATRATVAAPPLLALACAAALVVSGGRPPALPPLPPTPGPARLATAPPIVLVVLDTVRADHLALYGYARDTMPALGAWARDALVVKRAVSPGGWTSPSHASLFSGRSVSGHGIHYAGPRPAGGPLLRTRAREGIDWLPARLRAAGYRTVGVSANALAVPDEVEGFERVVVPRREAWNGATLAGLGHRLPFPTRPWSEALRWRVPYLDAEGVVDLAIGLGERARADGRPLFLFVNLLDAHSPYNPPPWALRELGLAPSRLFDRYDHHLALNAGWTSLPEGRAAVLRDLYDGELRFLDRHLARLLAWTRERLGDEAVVVVTSDHGEELGEEGRVGHEYGLAQRIIHVPLLLRAPGVAPGVVEGPVSTRHLYAFLGRLAAGGGADLALLAAGTGPVLSERYPSGYYAELLGPEHLRAWVALVDRELKVLGPSAAGPQAIPLDPDTFAERPDGASGPAADALAARIDAHWREERDRRASAVRAPDPEELERLRALGYVD